MSHGKTSLHHRHNQLSGAIAKTPEGREINKLRAVRVGVTSGHRFDTQVGPVKDPAVHPISVKNRTRRLRRRAQFRKPK